jgi:SPP1 gp7 family putative phage head morphogenesis protein
MTTPADRARKTLLDREKRQGVYFVREFRKIQQRLEKQIDETLIDIEAGRLAGEISPGLIARNLRLNKLLNAVTAEIEKMAPAFGGVIGLGQKQAIETARRQMSQTPEIGADLQFFDSEATKKLIGIAGNGQPLAKVFAKLATPIRQAVFDALFAGIATGSSNPVIAREINKALGTGAAAAMTIARTETNRAYREASREFYKETPAVIGWRWMSARDLHTCVICWRNHGRVFKNSVKMGTHPNCRCVMVPVFAGEAEVETGSKLFAKLTAAQQKTILGPRRFDLYNQGARLSDFVEPYKSPFGPGQRIKSLDRVTFKPRGGPAPQPKPPAPKPAARVTPPPALKPDKPAPRNFDFKTTKEAEIWASENYPGTVFDFDKIHVKAINPTLREFDKLAKEYPEVIARLKYVGTYRQKPVPYNEKLTIDPQNPRGYKRWLKFTRNSFAHASRDGFRIGLNPTYYGNLKKLQSSLDISAATGHLTSNKIELVMRHEFGHQVDNWIQSQGVNSFAEFVHGDGRGNVGEAWRAFKNKYKPTAALSRYSLTNREEMIAEGFAGIDSKPENDYARALNKFLTGYKDLKQFGPTQYKEFRDAPDKDAIRAEIRAIYNKLGLDYDTDI